jgi:hypothetical protein
MRSNINSHLKSDISGGPKLIKEINRMSSGTEGNQRIPLKESYDPGHISNN